MRMELMIWMFKGWWGWWWEWNWWYECLKDDEDDDENGTDDMNEAGPSTQKFIADKFRSENYVQCTVKHVQQCTCRLYNVLYILWTNFFLLYLSVFKMRKLNPFLNWKTPFHRFIATYKKGGVQSEKLLEFSSLEQNFPLQENLIKILHKPFFG